VRGHGRVMRWRLGGDEVVASRATRCSLARVMSANPASGMRGICLAVPGRKKGEPMRHTMIAAALTFAMTGCTADISSPAPAPARSASVAEARVALGALPARTQAHLSKADVNHDGVLTAGELSQHYAASVRATFQKLDRNGDGKLELSELPVGLRSTLAAADRDGDGAISSGEFLAHHNARVLARLRRA